jgi:hypothetical protein
MTERGDGAIFTRSINRRVTPTEKKRQPAGSRYKRT